MDDKIKELLATLDEILSCSNSSSLKDYLSQEEVEMEIISRLIGEGLSYEEAFQKAQELMAITEAFLAPRRIH